MGLLGQHTWKCAVPQGAGVHHALNPNPYRGAWGNDGPRYAADVADLIQSATPGGQSGWWGWGGGEGGRDGGCGGHWEAGGLVSGGWLASDRAAGCFAWQLTGLTWCGVSRLRFAASLAWHVRACPRALHPPFPEASHPLPSPP